MHRSLLLILLAGAASAQTPLAPPLEAIPGVREFSGRLIAKPRSAKPAEHVQARVSVSAAILREIPEVGEWILRVPAGETDAAYAARLQASGLFEYVHPDWLVAPALIPNDPMYASQWHLPRLNLPAAWDLTTGDPSVVVAYCDSGVDLAHPDLAANLISGYNSVDHLAQASGGNVAATNDHGTGVAGCIGALGNNGVGIAGAGWTLRVMPIRVTNLASGNALLSDINDGARWAADHGAKVVNISYSGVGNPTNSATGRYLRERGVSCVWAAGNASTTASGVDLPDLFVIGATTSSNSLATFSNFGPAIDVVAPGVGIVTTKVGGYMTIDGTSFAAPLTAGVLALTRSANPAWGVSESEFSLIYTARDLGPAGRDNTFGAGLVDAFAAVDLAHRSRTEPIAPVAIPDAVTVYAGSAIDLDVLANDVDFNGDALDFASVPTLTTAGPLEIVTGPSGKPVLRFTVDGAFRGRSIVTYTVRDPSGLTASSTVTLTVIPPPALAPRTVVRHTSVITPATTLRAVDLDGDGDLDIVAGTIFNIALFRNDHGVLTPSGSLDTVYPATKTDVADFNHDGKPDLVFTREYASFVGVALGAGPFTFAAPVTYPASFTTDVIARTESGAPIDLNSDGHGDIVFTNQTTNMLDARLGDGTGAFPVTRTYPVVISPIIVRAADLNGDGRADLISGNTGGQSISVLLSNTSGGYAGARTSRIGVSPKDLRVFDADGNGVLNLAVLCEGILGETAGVSILNPGSSGSYTLAAQLQQGGEAPVSMTAADFNRDGAPDLAVVNKDSGSRSLYAGNGAGLTPTPITEPSTLMELTSTLAADLDGDGVPDLITGGRVQTDLGTICALEIQMNRTPAFCPADFNGDGFLDFFDYSAFVDCFEAGVCPAAPAARTADFNHDAFVDFFDYIDFVTAFEAGC